MASKNVNEALEKSDIKMIIKEAIMIGPAFELEERIDAAEILIKKNITNQLRDMLSHRCQVFGFKNGCDKEIKRFFDDIFGGE